mgnify:CR=1 FL=1
MNVGFFTDTWLPNTDGVVNSMLASRGELEKRGHKVSVFTSGDKKTRKGKRVFVHRSIKLPAYPQYKLALFPYASAARQAHNQGLDVIHSHAIASMGLAAIGAAKALNLPLVGTYHTMLPSLSQYLTSNERGQYYLSKATWRAIKLFYNSFDAVYAPSEVIRRELEEHGVQNTSVVSNGINVKRFNPRAGATRIRKKLGAKNKKIVLTAGRMGFEKNVDTIIKAAPRVLREHDALFVIGGKGPAKEMCEALVKEFGLGDAVKFAGFIPDDELPAYYAAADAFVTGSTFETQGLVVLEAMACGTPVVGANALAIPEAVKNNENGYLFEALDAGDCAAKINKLLGLKKSSYKRMAGKAREFAENKSVESVTDDLLKEYEKVF